jgi:hypothetical protein
MPFHPSAIRWSVRDLMWLSLVLGLLVFLVMAMPAWKRTLREEAIFPYAEPDSIRFDVIDSGRCREANVVTIGGEAAMKIELHEFDDLATTASNESLIDEALVAPGRYGILWWKQENSDATQLYCACDGRLLSYELARQDANIRECGSSGAPLHLAVGEGDIVVSLVENRDGSDVKRVELIVKCVDVP